jgi:four helix bundle protein
MLIAYEVALDLVRALRPVVAQLRSYSPEAADQVERAASSIVLNLAEGGRRHGRDPRRFWDIAHGSAGEIRGALDLADAWGWQVDGAHARVLLDRELGLLWGSPVGAEPRPRRGLLRQGATCRPRGEARCTRATLSSLDS